VVGGTYYDTLGVPPSATAEEIKRAYRLMAVRHHPDVQAAGQGDEALRSAQRRMAAISTAYRVLGDPARRRDYDLTLGRRPRPEPAPDVDDMDVEERYDRLGVDDETDGPAARRRPGDLIMLVPAALAVLAVGIFAFGVMVQSHALWATAVVLAPVAGMSFLAAPLVGMLRARPPRSQDQSRA
jgi:hypothetical protein